MDQPDRPAAGWFPDPSGQPGQRYYDGQRWTQHFVPTPPPSAPAPPPSVAVAVSSGGGANHALHAVLTFLSCGLWLPIWILAAIFGGGRSNDDEGGGGFFGTILMAILAPIAAMLVQMAISRSREFGADAGGASICGNPLSLANALQKLEMANRQIPMQQASPATAHMFIVNPLTGGGLMSLFSTHPPMQERVARLQEMSRTHNY